MKEQKEKLPQERTKDLKSGFKTAIILVITLLSIVFFAYILILLTASNRVLEKKELLGSLRVSDRYGFDLSPDKFSFGMVAPGGSVSRELNVDNKYSFPVKVKVTPRQDMKKFVPAQEFVIPPNEQRKIGISAYAPLETGYGNYTGNISVTVSMYIFKS